MATREEILGQVRHVLVETFELDPGDIVPDAHLYHDLDLDSLDAIDLAVKLGTHTGIKLKEEEMKAIRTVADIVDFVHRNLDPAKSLGN
ncbi:acyl carrier protein [Sulfidibacter corallicola]|uniref:Acyl carrier protein n=1 Tax=Sulfidibacter corallicola TaxID=2818388 RepID=A0A8A4TJ23_SULCO|nr:acyl carrier protein [Sulfidibacter corallicola]QTD49550.1 acyl carrier protein [Sulfidibacter corallicola]